MIDPYAYPPRAFDLAAAARYLGLTPTAFSALVRVGQLPSARQLGVTAVWDRMALDAAFDAAAADEVQPNGKPVQKQRGTPAMSKEWPGYHNAYTPETLGERWSCSPNHIRVMIRRGQLAGRRIGRRFLRISTADVIAYENTDTGKGLPKQPSADKGESGGVDRVAFLVRHQNGDDLALAILRDFVSGYRWQQALGLKGSGLQVGAFGAHVVAQVKAVMDVEEVTRHRLSAR